MSDRPGRNLEARPALPCGPDPRATGHDLVELTRAYLACLGSGIAPAPHLVSAWGEFYRTYEPIVTRMARHRSGLSGNPEDRAQDLWQTILNRLGGLQPDPTRGPFRSWLMVVARRRLADQRRRDARMIHPGPWDGPPDEIVGTEPGPGAACEREDDRAVLAGLLSRLRARVSPLSYRVLELRAIEDLPVPEVARLVGLSPAQVRARHHRMLVTLRELAGIDGEPAPPEPSGNFEKISPAAQQRPSSRRVTWVESTSTTASLITA